MALLRGELEGGSVSEVDALLLHHLYATVDDGLVELEVGDAVAEEATGGLVLLEDGDHVTHLVEGVGGSKACRTSSDDGYLHSVSLRHSRLDIPFAEGGLYDGTLVLTVGCRLMVEAVQHAGLFAECRTDATRKLWKGVGARQQPVCQFPITFIQGIIPFRCLVAQWAGPVAKGHTAVHAARGLFAALVCVECLLHLAEVVNPVVNRTVARLQAVYL